MKSSKRYTYQISLVRAITQQTCTHICMLKHMVMGCAWNAGQSRPLIGLKTNRLTQTNKVIQRCSPFVPTAIILVNKQNLPVNIILIFFMSFKEREKWADINDTSFESNFAVSCVRLREVMLKQYYLVELGNGSINYMYATTY